MRACIYSVPSQIRVIDAVDADYKHPEGRSCPDPLLVVGKSENLLILASGTKRRVLRRSCEDPSMIDEHMVHFPLR